MIHQDVADGTPYLFFPGCEHRELNVSTPGSRQHHALGERQPRWITGCRRLGPLSRRGCRPGELFCRHHLIFTGISKLTRRLAQIRDFLYEKIAEQEHLRDAAEARLHHDECALSSTKRELCWRADPLVRQPHPRTTLLPRLRAAQSPLRSKGSQVIPGPPATRTGCLHSRRLRAPSLQSGRLHQGRNRLCQHRERRAVLER